MVRLALFVATATLTCAALAGCAGSADLRGTPTGRARADNRVRVYYMHKSFRCLSCLWIEDNTRKALEEGFASEIAAGRIEFRSEDYWSKTDLARRFGVDNVSVVLVQVVDGNERSHENLNRVWELKGQSARFRAYIVEAVRAALARTPT